MPHDRNGVEIKTGDHVTMEFVVKDVYPHDWLCNVSLESVERFYPNDDKTSLSAVNTRQVVKVND